MILHLSELIERGMEAKTQEWNVSSYENVGLMPRPPPPLLPLPPRTPPRPPLQLQPPPHPRVSPDLQPFCLVGLRTTLAASWRDALKTLQTSPSTWTPATRP